MAKKIAPGNREEVVLKLRLPRETMLEFRKALFARGFSIQEYVAYSMLMLSMRNDKAITCLEEAHAIKNSPANLAYSQAKTVQDIYAIIARSTALKKLKPFVSKDSSMTSVIDNNSEHCEIDLLFGDSDKLKK